MSHLNIAFECLYKHCIALRFGNKQIGT